MSRDYKVISGSGMQESTHRILSQEEKIKHLQNVTEVILDDALDVWNSLWREMKGKVTDATLVLPGAEKGFKPGCGWPEFLERLWLLKHHLDYAKKFCKQKI